jgi:hypothetical protein
MWGIAALRSKQRGKIRPARVHEEEQGRGLGADNGQAQWRWALVGRCSHAYGVEQGRAHVGRSREWKMGGAKRNRGIFDLFKSVSKGSDLIRLKDGLSEF